MSLITTLKNLKNNNIWFKYLWLEYILYRGRYEEKHISDIDCINRIYRRFSGGVSPDLDNPTKFSEKMQWLKLYYRNPDMPTCADKFKVRTYINAHGLGFLLNDLIAVYDKNNIQNFSIHELPDKFVLKATHGSGWNLIVREKNSVNWKVQKLIMKNWLKQNIFWNGREWPYKSITPRIVCERYLEDASGALIDYKFYCFNGEPKFLQVNLGRGKMDSVQNYYDLNWELLPFGKSQPYNPNVKIEQPLHFTDMLQYSKTLSSEFPYVRVDFYEANNTVYFGELTFFPCSGMPDFIPPEWDKIVGELLTLPKAII